MPQQQAQPVQAFGAAASLLRGSTTGGASPAAVTQSSTAQQAASRHLSPARRSRQELHGAVDLWPELQWPTRCVLLLSVLMFLPVMQHYIKHTPCRTCSGNR